MKVESLTQLLKNSLQRVITAPKITKIIGIKKIDESLTPNMRALRLTMTIAEQLLSMGVAARDVVNMSIGITNTYCTRYVHMDISSTMITLSQDRGNNREPLTMIRTILSKDTNYQTIQELQQLATSISTIHLPLSKAEEKADKILAHPKSYPNWLICCSSGAVCAGVVLLYNGDVLMTLLTFLIGSTIAVILKWFSKIGMSTFYSQAAASLFITLITTLIVWANATLKMDINPNLIAIGGIVSLVAGMMIVGAFQDAIDEYYVTANARFLRVIMATAGIVTGVLGGLYVAANFNISFPTTPDGLRYADAYGQYMGALIISGCFALGNHARIFSTIIAGLVGVFGWWTCQMLMSSGVDALFTYGVAAALIGLASTFISRIWRTPAIAIIAAGVVPLVPGLSLYNGLMGLVAHTPESPEFIAAIGILARAVMIGFVVAAGATFGNMVGRPIQKQAAHLYNRLPRRNLSN